MTNYPLGGDTKTALKEQGVRQAGRKGKDIPGKGTGKFQSQSVTECGAQLNAHINAHSFF